MLVGILFKVSAAPFHVWDAGRVRRLAHSGRRADVHRAQSSGLCVAACAWYTEMLPTLRSVWQPLLWVVAVLSMTVGNLAALRQQNVKRMLAYSAIAHAGYLLAAFAALDSTGIAAASFYIAAYEQP